MGSLSNEVLHMVGGEFRMKNGYSNGTSTDTITFTGVAGAGIIIATGGHYGANGYQAMRVTQFQVAPGSNFKDIHDITSANFGSWSFTWSTADLGTLTCTKNAGTYGGSGPLTVCVISY